MGDIVIRAEGLGKAYQIRHEVSPSHDRLSEMVTHRARRLFLARRNSDPTHETFWALRDVSFDIRKGEVVGIIGRNGSGKSTLLKILSRITEPTEGRVEITGRIASLLEVGTGFHPELTGRENIFLNGVILGMGRAEVQRKLDEIVEFAGIDKFLDTPVKRYSSGMYVRLAFAVAAHIDPEILIVDEVLSVGDVEFQRKCLGRMSEVAESGRTVLFVSHNMSTIQALCRSGLHLEGGRVKQSKNIECVIKSYILSNNNNNIVNRDLFVNGLTIIGTYSDVLARSGARFSVSFKISAQSELDVHDFCVIIKSKTGIRIAVADARNKGVVPIRVNESAHKIEFSFEGIHLIPGEYIIDLYIGVGGEYRDFHQIGEIQVVGWSMSENRISYPLSSCGFMDIHSSFSVHVENLVVSESSGV